MALTLNDIEEVEEIEEVVCVRPNFVLEERQHLTASKCEENTIDDSVVNKTERDSSHQTHTPAVANRLTELKQ